MRKKVTAIAFILSISLILTIVSLEIYLRAASFSLGGGVGRASQRWFSLNWKPINKLGYRDYEIDFNSKLPQILFLGDSFTAGHGVNFDDTYYFQTRNLGNRNCQYVNLGVCGASTKNELVTLDNYLQSYHPAVQTVVHQYFGNDIEDYIQLPPIKRQTLPGFLLKNSEIANFLESLIFTKRFSKVYSQTLFGTYLDPVRFGTHVADIDKLHSLIRKQNSRLIFLLFPFLDNDKTILESSDYISLLSNYFVQTCSGADVMIDATLIARTLRPKDRVVNKFDAHPSVRLHKLVSEVLSEILNQKIVNHESVIWCPNKRG